MYRLATPKREAVSEFQIKCKSQRQKVIDSDQATLVESALEVCCMDKKVCAADSEYLALVVANG